jgi:hypothetical protein
MPVLGAPYQEHWQDQGQSSVTYSKHDLDIQREVPVDGNCQKDVRTEYSTSGSGPPFSSPPYFEFNSFDSDLTLAISVAQTKTTTTTTYAYPGHTCAGAGTTTTQTPSTFTRTLACNFADHSTSTEKVFDGDGQSGQGGYGCTGQLTTAQNASPAGLHVALAPVDAPASGDTFPITLTLTNTSLNQRLNSITPVNEFGFGVASSYYEEPGELQILSGPDPAFPTSLGPGESSTNTIMAKATGAGSVGLEAKVTAIGAGSGEEVADADYGEALIGESPAGAQRPATVATGVALFLDEAKRTLLDQQARYADLLYAALQSRLSPKAQKFYFGSTSQLKITPYEQALARWQGVAPELMALATPNKQKLYEGGSVYMTEKQFARFREQENAETLRLVNEYLGGAYDTVAGEARYWAQATSQEGRGRIATDLALWREYNHESGEQLLTKLAEVKRVGALQALDDADAAIKAPLVKALDDLVAARDARINELTELAESDPDAFIATIAKDSAGLGFEGFKVTAETLMGDAAFNFAGKVFTGARAAITKFAEAIGVSTPAGAKAFAKTVVISERAAELGSSYVDELSEEAKHFVTLRKMEDLGGMPVGDVEITKGIVRKVNERLHTLGYTDTEIELLFRPANPYKVEGAFAKVETVGVKNIAPIDLALGAPPPTLAETAIFKPRKPESLPGFDSYPELEKTLLQDRYKTRLSEYNQFFGHEPVTDKKMREMLKAFGDKPHVFDQIGKGRKITMRLTTDEVEGATVLKYDYLDVQGKKLIDGKGKPVPIGTDYDGAAIINKKTRQLLTGQELSAAEFELARLGEKAAIKDGYANPFHGYTANGTDADARDYPFFAFYWLLHLKKEQALLQAQRIADAFNAASVAQTGAYTVTAEQLLKKTSGIYERHLLRVSESDASFGPADVVFTKPLVVPK